MTEILNNFDRFFHCSSSFYWRVLSEYGFCFIKNSRKFFWFRFRMGRFVSWLRGSFIRWIVCIGEQLYKTSSIFVLNLWNFSLLFWPTLLNQANSRRNWTARLPALNCPQETAWDQNAPFCGWRFCSRIFVVVVRLLRKSMSKKNYV